MKTEIVAIIDHSGSMSGLRKTTVSGFNEFLHAQQKLDLGEANLTLVVFDSTVKTLYDAVNINDVPDLDDTTYWKNGGGMTALFDAIGSTMNTVGHRLANSSKYTDKVIMLIITDGLDNASKEYNRVKVKGMVEHQQSKYGWDVIYMGANQDAFEVGDSFGVSRDTIVNYDSTVRGTQKAYATMNVAARNARSGVDNKNVQASYDSADTDNEDGALINGTNAAANCGN